MANGNAEPCIDICFQEQLNFEKTLPKLVWSIIVKKMDYETCQNLYIASPYFRELLKHKRTAILFPHVLKVLASNHFFLHEHETSKILYPNETTIQSEDIRTVEKDGEVVVKVAEYEECEMVVTKLLLNTMLKLRLISKDCKNAVNQWFESKPFSVIKSEHQEPLELINYYESRGYSFTPLHLRAFMQKFNLHANLNPIVGRAVRFRSVTSFYYAAIQAFLEKYGREIWHCSVQLVQYENDNVGHIIQQLKRQLELMPNLKVLHVILDPYFPFYSWADLIPDYNIGSMPVLAKLEELKVESVPPELFRALLDSNSHVKLLGISQIHTREIIQIGSLCGLANLKWFGLRLHQEAQMSFYLEPPCKIVCPSSTSHVVFICDSIASSFEGWKLFFDVANRSFGQNKGLTKFTFEPPKLPKSADELKKIFVENMSNNNNNGDFFLQIPQVKHVVIHLKDYIPLDILNCCKDVLEILEVVVYKTHNLIPRENEPKPESYELCVANQQVKFIGYLDNLKDTNLFTWFPKLKLVNIKANVRGKLISLKLLRR